MLGATGSVTTLGGIASSSIGAAQHHDENSFDVVSAELKEEKLQSRTTAVTYTHPLVNDLIAFMKEKTGMEAWSDSTIYIDIETDDRRANSYDPQISVIPFGDNSSTNPSPESNKAGFLFIFTVVEDGEQVPVGLFGLTATGREDGRYDVGSFGLEDGSPTQFSSRVVSGSGTDSSGGVTIQDTIRCEACKTVVGTICTGVGGVVGRYACVAACSVAFGANFIAIFGCATICSALTQAVAAVGCNAGKKSICQYAQRNSPISFGC